jgi:hypothetical protein
LNVSKDEFVQTILTKRYQKSLNVWRQDVIKPRLQLSKLCMRQIKVTDADLKSLYENRYGEKAKCKVVIWPNDQEQSARREYAKFRESTKAYPDRLEEAWYEMSRQNSDIDLALKGGSIAPIGRNSGPESAAIEKLAFSLTAGQISELVKIEGTGLVVVRRVGTEPAAKDIRFEDVKDNLRKQFIERRLEREVVNYFAKLKLEAKPNILLKDE